MSIKTECTASHYLKYSQLKNLKLFIYEAASRIRIQTKTRRSSSWLKVVAYGAGKAMAKQCVEIMYCPVSLERQKDYLRDGWGVPKMVMWGSQDQEISPSKWIHRNIANSSLGLEYFIMKINQHILIWS
jgi:hypothetical protein